ncbi:Endoglucanase E [Pelomyxa schiedti]|nr:Endoglucanase E [Pelomyxa schiedti]
MRRRGTRDNTGKGYCFNPIVHEKLSDRLIHKQLSVSGLEFSDDTQSHLRTMLAEVPKGKPIILARNILESHLEYFAPIQCSAASSGCDPICTTSSAASLSSSTGVNNPSHSWDPDMDPRCFDDINTLIEYCLLNLQMDPPLVRVDQPAILYGDVHGNYQDLLNFLYTFGLLHLEISTSKVVFLGDYIDKGPHSLETITMIIALKVLHPSHVFLLRGNHETRHFEKNGGSNFLNQCIAAYGEADGTTLYNKFHNLFNFFPVAAIVDDQIFCVHGGLPRTMAQPDFYIIPFLTNLSHPVDLSNPSLSDLLWADPILTPPADETLVDGIGPGRTKDTISFGKSIVDKFMSQTGCTHIVRAHGTPNAVPAFVPDETVHTLFTSQGPKNIHASAMIIHNQKLSIVLLDARKTIISSPSLHISSS